MHGVPFQRAHGPAYLQRQGRLLDAQVRRQKSYDIDAAIVTTHMMLEAASIGVGTTWVMHFRPQVVREEFALPDNYEASAMLMMGYPAPDAEPYPGHFEFKDEKELVFYNEF